jgi:putative ABC transport system ATP-binding protein
VLFADEPTGALDTKTGHQILALLRQAVDQEGQTVVMVTHDPNAAARADRVVYLADGLLHGEQWQPSASEIADQLTKLGD